MSAARTRILMIDDDVDLAMVVAATLEAQGYDVKTAVDGEKGLELAYTFRPNLILLDVMMPGMDGHQVCHELQFGHTKDIPVVFLTAKCDLSHMMEANRSGAAAYITKPFQTANLLATVRDILRDASVYVDEITGLPTLASVHAEVQRGLFDHRQLGILYVTVDGVHGLEAAQGFEAVDRVFKIIGMRLDAARGSILRHEDFVSISSLGNAFLVVLSPARTHSQVSDADLFAVKARLEKQLLDGIREGLEERLRRDLDLYVGYARLSLSPKVRFRRALLHAVEQAMRGIRREQDAVQHRLQVEFDRVLAAEDISCVYQPILRLDDYAVLGYEILSRGPDMSQLQRPEALFELARDAGRVTELDRICRLAAARGSACLPSRYLRFINTEPLALFYSSRSDLFIKEFLAAIPEDMHSQTVIEITENSAVADFAHIRNLLKELRDRGFRVAVDDAGAGYAGLQTMVELEPDFIKLDISLTRSIERSVVKQRLVGMLRDFCSQTDTQLIAEGVETRQQLDALLDLGITYGQGYLFAYPASPYPQEADVSPPPAVMQSVTGRVERATE